MVFRGRRGLIAGLILLAAGDAGAQGLSVDVAAGRLVYDPIASAAVSNSVLGSVRYDAGDAWVYGSSGLPLSSSDTFWTAAGAGRHVDPLRGRVRVGVDLSANGYVFRDAVTTDIGSGGTLEAFPFARVVAGKTFASVTGGWRGHALTVAGDRTNRSVVEGGVQGGYAGALNATVDLRWVRATEGTFPFAGGSLSYGGSRVAVWGRIGKWLSTTLDDVAWATGASVPVGAHTSVWAMLEEATPDPLYWNVARRTWSAGMTFRPRRAASSIPVVPRSDDGGAIIRLKAADAPAGPISVAGDFNNWQPVPMQREGSEWVVRLPLAPGVYHYSFRSAAGEWFVPPSAPRRDDGMGGQSALLVVS